MIRVTPDHKHIDVVSGEESREDFFPLFALAFLFDDLKRSLGIKTLELRSGDMCVKKYVKQIIKIIRWNHEDWRQLNCDRSLICFQFCEGFFQLQLLVRWLIGPSTLRVASYKISYFFKENILCTVWNCTGSKTTAGRRSASPMNLNTFPSVQYSLWYSISSSSHTLACQQQQKQQRKTPKRGDRKQNIFDWK